MNENEKNKMLISAYIDGAVTPEEKAYVEELLIDSVQWQNYYKELIKLSSTLKEWPDETLSPDLADKIQRNYLEEKVKEDKQMKKDTFKLPIGGGAVITIAAVLIVGLLFSQTYLKRSPQGRLNLALDAESDLQHKSTIRLDDDSAFVTGKQQAQPAKDAADKKSFAREIKSVNESVTPAIFMKKGKVLGDSRQATVPGKAPSSSVQYEPYYLTTNYQVTSQANAVSDGLDMLAARAQSRHRMSSTLYEKEESSFIQPVVVPPTEGFSTEEYARIYENEFKTVLENPLSTFSIDVDTGSYSNIRRFLNSNQMPAKDAVRIEEMINYFSYDYPQPTGKHPFSVLMQAAACPWNQNNQLVQIGIQGKSLNTDELPPSNLVFLLDVSGSMNQANKLPLLKSAFKMMINQIGENERVAIVVYAGAAGTVLDSTPGNEKRKILEAIERLNAGGSTAGGAGIELAYKIAKDNFIKNGNNRVILATDGDFNVGVSSTGDLTRLIEEKRNEGVFLTVLGFGSGNYKDSRMEQLANKGNGNYYYIDTDNEGRKVLVNELGSTLFTIAKDVKIQIEFNPDQVKAYRLIGYENRMLAKEDFNDDTKDAGELGAGHNVTALYEIVPADSKEKFSASDVDDLTYQKRSLVKSQDLMTVKLRYKKPDEDKSSLIKDSITLNDILVKPEGDFAFAAAVAEFGLLLRDSKFKANASYQHVIETALSSQGKDPYQYRREFIELVRKAQSLDVNQTQGEGIFFKSK